MHNYWVITMDQVYGTKKRTKYLIRITIRSKNQKKKKPQY